MSICKHENGDGFQSVYKNVGGWVDIIIYNQYVKEKSKHLKRFIIKIKKKPNYLQITTLLITVQYYQSTY